MVERRRRCQHWFLAEGVLFEARSCRNSSGVESPCEWLPGPSTYGRMFSDVERLFLLDAVHLSETHKGLAALNEAKKADARDIAEVAAIALTERGHEGKTCALVEPRVTNGHATAEIWRTNLVKRVN